MWNVKVCNLVIRIIKMFSKRENIEEFVFISMKRNLLFLEIYFLILSFLELYRFVLDLGGILCVFVSFVFYDVVENIFFLKFDKCFFLFLFR